VDLLKAIGIFVALLTVAIGASCGLIYLVVRIVRMAWGG
jgi:hypothetical protein